MSHKNLDDIVIELAEDIKRRREATKASLEEEVKRVLDSQRSPVEKAFHRFSEWWEKKLIPAFWFGIIVLTLMFLSGAFPQV